MRVVRADAVLTASGLGSPLGRLAVGPVFARYGNTGVWLGISGGLTVGALLFIGAAVHADGDDAPAAQATASNM